MSEANTKWVTAEVTRSGNDNGMLRARATKQNAWERYKFSSYGGHTVIKSLQNGKYVSAEVLYAGDINGMMRARATKKGPWEQFDFITTPYGCAIKSVGNGKYVSAEIWYPGDTNGMLRARATTIGPWELFMKTTVAPPDLSQQPFLKCVRAHESDTQGGYKAYNPGGPAYGAYQFLQSTWDTAATHAGHPELVGRHANDVAPHLQDVVAWDLVNWQGPSAWTGTGCEDLAPQH